MIHALHSLNMYSLIAVAFLAAALLVWLLRHSIVARNSRPLQLSVSARWLHHYDEGARR
jgi:hypothetical protein